MVESCLSCGYPVKKQTDNYGNVYGVCTRCGATYHSSSKNVNDTAVKNNPVTKKSNSYLIPVIILSCVLACMCITYVFIRANNKSTYSQTETVSERTIKNTGSKTVKNIDSKIENIRTMYYDTQNSLSDLSITYMEEYTVYYDSQKEVKKADFKIPHKNLNACYYYDDNNLYFAFIYDETHENRFYIYKDTVFRWIDENGNITDNGFDDEEYMSWSEMIFEEDKKFKSVLNELN